MHCAHYAADLDVKSIVVPLGPTASAFSAFGLAASDVVVTVERSVPENYPVPAETVNAIFDGLEAEATARIDDQGLGFEEIELRREIDIRYSLQLAEVTTPVDSVPLTDEGVAAVAASSGLP